MCHTQFLSIWREKLEEAKHIVTTHKFHIVPSYSIFCDPPTTYIPYTAKLSREKTFAIVHKTHYSLENFHGASGPCHYVLYTANDSRGKLSRLAKKPQKPRKFSPSKVLPCTVLHACLGLT